jgi:hypothetical protein
VSGYKIKNEKEKEESRNYALRGTSCLACGTKSN